ncbi:hypothetical protein T552_04119 [Pneumocystis carinii B80]|uniref:Uncharacterized protein n=1 Tax=Pneumocystis carinii (strain B80) TaxID=1408658 RepID=A0A0W4ZJ13_PNEC8|nr:hypothetical protein T552_04119 [Pneumocystis carinii B80]KTW28369.1 hypothetical protein T552_04119 [Pneumocystis carinii B80]
MEQLTKESILKLYQEFRQAPSQSIFSDQCILTYVTTCIRFSGSKNILLQLSEYQTQIKLKEEVINLHVAGNSIVSEVFLDIEFVSGPAWLVPGLEDNFYIDRKIQLPHIYIIEFDENEKISHIRVFWDQATILKQLEIFSNRRQALPIKLGKEQHHFMKNKGIIINWNIMHFIFFISNLYLLLKQETPRMLSLFEPYEEPSREFHHNPVRPRSPTRPIQRPYEDLFVAKGTPISVKPPKACQKIHNVSNINSILFNEYEEPNQQKTNVLKKNPKFTHFEFSTPTEKELEEERLAILAKTKKGAALRAMSRNWTEFENTPVTQRKQDVSNQVSENAELDKKKHVLLNAKSYHENQLHFSFSNDSPTENPPIRVTRNEAYCQPKYSIFDYSPSEQNQDQNTNIEKADTITRLERDMNAKWSFGDY